MEKAAYILLKASDDKWLNVIMVVVVVPILCGIFTPQESVVNKIAEYAAYILIACYVVRCIYVVRVGRKDMVPENIEKHVFASRKQALCFFLVNMLIALGLFIFSLIFRIPVALPLSAALLVIWIAGLVFALWKYRKR